jgi:hypothetical protein
VKLRCLGVRPWQDSCRLHHHVTSCATLATCVSVSSLGVMGCGCLDLGFQICMIAWSLCCKVQLQYSGCNLVTISVTLKMASCRVHVLGAAVMSAAEAPAGCLRGKMQSRKGNSGG